MKRGVGGWEGVGGGGGDCFSVSQLSRGSHALFSVLTGCKLLCSSSCSIREDSDVKPRGVPLPASLARDV